jgi:tetratricopeptide (TPR) repeat protein
MAKPLEDLFDLVNSQKYSEAIIHLKEFIKKDKDNWNAWHLLGQAYRYLDDLENAIACHEKAYSIKKDHPAVLLALGIAYQLNKNYIDAIKALEEAIRIDKHYTLAYNSLALTYKRLDSLDKSIETYINGMNTIAIKFCLTLENLKTNKIYKHQNIVGNWVKSILQGGIYLSVFLEYDAFLMPTGEQAEYEEKTEEHKGLYWFVRISKDGNRCFQVLPNLLNTYREFLKGNSLYISMLRDLSLVYELQGNKSEALSCRQEADYFEN